MAKKAHLQKLKKIAKTCQLEAKKSGKEGRARLKVVGSCMKREWRK